jgi:uncharacterized membrane protein YkvA (DUF1232 family)
MKYSKLENENYIAEYGKHYSEEKFHQKILKIAKSAGIKVIYAALLLFYAVANEHFPKKERMWIIGALGYLIFPFDLIADFIPLAGYADDLAALFFVLKKVYNHITPEVHEKAKAKVRSIFGKVADDEFKLF